MKKIISLLLTALMLLSAFSFTVSADDVYEGLPFTDVKEGAWYYEGIEFCYLMGVVSGMTETTFEPNGTLTRAQFVQILAMYDGVELEAYKNNDSGFDDVKTNHWFNAPVCWAVEQGFVAGLSETRFGPNEKITREQLARLLYLYAEARGYDVSRLADLSGYTDKPSDWAHTQVQWAVAAGIISGMTETTIAPRASATRAQACRMIMSYFNFECYGYRDMGGAYAVIVEYIKANGEYFSDEGYYSYFAEYEGYDIIMEYVESDESISIAYLTEPYEIVEGEDVWINYRESAGIYAYSLASEYDFYYIYENANGTDYMNSYGYMTIDGYNEYSNELEGYENTELIDRVANGQAYIREHIALILAEADMTLEDFFLPKEDMGDEMQELYDALVRYIYDEGVEYPDGKHIGLITDNGNEAYVTEYVLETGEICLVYVTEPIPGGTDIFDTSYRERVIFIPDILTGSLWWQYTYESEDGTVKISASGTDADEDNYANLTFEGISEEDAKAKFDAAMDNTVLHFLGLMIDAASYIAYDELVDYVVTNGIAFAGGIDLVKDEGNKGYVAEYDDENDAIYFIYVSEPIPGGTDIFDTSYREKAIIMFDPPLNSEYFIYTYENEDGSVKLSAEGSYDGFEIAFDNFEYTGLSEEEATAKINAALEETMSYYTEIMSQTIA
ncbi:MAG: S-layer homology domain-containing protein [Clostridia bacterium]|nr:S-layer homology domain-containing protein [Clostridia bacterium]